MIDAWKNINNVIVTGKIFKDVDYKILPKGTSLAKFMIVNELEKEKNFLPIVCWGNLADQVAEMFKKDAFVQVEGRIKTGNYEKDGKKVYTTDIVANSVNSCN